MLCYAFSKLVLEYLYDCSLGFYCLEEQISKVCEGIAQTFVELNVLEFLDFSKKKKYHDITKTMLNVLLIEENYIDLSSVIFRFLFCMETGRIQKTKPKFLGISDRSWFSSYLLARKLPAIFQLFAVNIIVIFF